MVRSLSEPFWLRMLVRMLKTFANISIGVHSLAQTGSTLSASRGTRHPGLPCLPLRQPVTQLHAMVYLWPDPRSLSSLLALNYSFQGWGGSAERSSQCATWYWQEKITPVISRSQGSPGIAGISGVAVFIRDGRPFSGEMCPSVC